MALTPTLFSAVPKEDEQKRKHKPVTSVQAPASVWLVRCPQHRQLHEHTTASVHGKTLP